MARPVPEIPLHTLSVRIPVTVLEAIDNVAEAETRHRSQMVNVLLQEAIKARGQQIPDKPKQ